MGFVVHDHVHHYWWIVFPLMWLCFALVRTWLNWRSQQAWLEIVRAYAAKGQTPPPEMMAMAQADPTWRCF